MNGFKTVCAWCEEHLDGPEKPEKPNKVTHGICPPCQDRVIIRLHRSIDPLWVDELYSDKGGEG